MAAGQLTIGESFKHNFACLNPPVDELIFKTLRRHSVLHRTTLDNQHQHDLVWNDINYFER